MDQPRLPGGLKAFLHDGIELDRRGVPAAVIRTDVFVARARARAAIAGDPGCRFAVVPHPIGSSTTPDLRERAAAALPQVVLILTGAPGD